MASNVSVICWKNVCHHQLRLMGVIAVALAQPTRCRREANMKRVGRQSNQQLQGPQQQQLSDAKRAGHGCLVILLHVDSAVDTAMQDQRMKSETGIH
mmetsp:Transcript_137399/g.274155  ORF Transcript_137399/g.274155 Transcript_137399/m.274155 type:complete len:97 (-) Transcript_137399:1075-1365(-)